MIGRLVLAGATGDLASRFLFPALAALHASGELDSGFRLIGVATQDLDDDGFKRLIARSLQQHAGGSSEDGGKKLIEGASYRSTDITDASSVRSLLEVTRGSGDGAVAVYLALPPTAFAPALKALSSAGIRPRDRIAMEKPFGQSMDDARALNALARRLFQADEEQIIYRVDHVLGMTTTRRLGNLRQSHIFDSVWDSRHIERVSILWEETLALEGRAAYYDRFGALRDVVQNHVLQLLATVAMEPPANGRQDNGTKYQALRSVAQVDADSVAARTRRARYSAGVLTGGRPVRSYRDEEGVEPERMTETFAEIVLDIDNARWRGTPFVLRAGKALERRCKGVLVTFRSRVEPAPGVDELWIGIDGPDDIALSLDPEGDDVLELRADPPASTLPAYGRVLRDLLGGTSALAVGTREAEETWRIVTPVLDAWTAGAVPLEEYAAGSAGPGT